VADGSSQRAVTRALQGRVPGRSGGPRRLILNHT
jgi:hypothetical protein